MPKYQIKHPHGLSKCGTTPTRLLRCIKGLWSGIERRWSSECMYIIDISTAMSKTPITQTQGNVKAFPGQAQRNSKAFYCPDCSFFLLYSLRLNSYRDLPLRFTKDALLTVHSKAISSIQLYTINAVSGSLLKCISIRPWDTSDPVFSVYVSILDSVTIVPVRSIPKS